MGFKDSVRGFYFFFEAVRNAPQDSELFYRKKLVEFHVNWTAYNLRSQFFPSIGTFRHFYQGCNVFFLRETPLKTSQYEIYRKMYRKYYGILGYVRRHLGIRKKS